MASGSGEFLPDAYSQYVGMVVVHAGQAPQPRGLFGMPFVQVPYRVGFFYLSAAIHHLISGGPQTLDPLIRKQLLQQNVPVLEVELALLLGKDFRLDRKNLLWGHGLSHNFVRELAFWMPGPNLSLLAFRDHRQQPVCLLGLHAVGMFRIREFSRTHLVCIGLQSIDGDFRDLRIALGEFRLELVEYA